MFILSLWVLWEGGSHDNICEPIIHRNFQTSPSLIFQKYSVTRLSLVHYTFLQIYFKLGLKGRRSQLSGTESDRDLRRDVESLCVEKSEHCTMRS
jgi:hypothetical protein